MLDVEFCRRQFPSFSTEPTSNWAFFENAGGSYVPASVCDWLDRCFREYKVQPYGHSAMSIRLGEEMDQAHSRIADMLNAGEDELTLGPSTTLNVYVLAQAMKGLLEHGDEIIVTNQDHEANIGAWRRLEGEGFKVRQWSIDPVSGELDVAELEELVSDKTRLVCFSLCSNVVGTMNDARAISRVAHDAGALVVADGVSYAPHRVVDVTRLGADFILFSTYKTFGTHQGVMWGKPEALARLSGQSHYFNEHAPRYRMNPTGPQHAQIAALNGMVEYFDEVYRHHFPDRSLAAHERAREVSDLFAAHEAVLANKLLDYLRDNPAVRLIGKDRAGGGERASTISFHTRDRSAAEVAEHLAAGQVGVGCGNFYALRCVEALGIPGDPGVIRASMVHYNTEQEVDRLLEGLDEVL
jgi:cysteine desulfurase family protein (TIGR01976 family)